MQAITDQLKIKLADFEAQIRDRNVELEQTQDQVIAKDEQIMQLRMEIEMRQHEESIDEARNQEQKSLRRDFDRAQLQNNKANEEVEWLKKQLVDQKVKLKEANDENEELQDKLLEIKSNYINNPQ